MKKGNKGEWSEPYAAIKMIGEKKLFLADKNDSKNPNEWMEIIELIRHETSDRIVKYTYGLDNVIVDIFVNDELIISVDANQFLIFAEKLAVEIRNGKGKSFSIPDETLKFLKHIEINHIKAKAIDKSDIFLSIMDPRASIVRNHIGFSIKSEFGENPTLFNTAKSSAAVFEISNITDDLMNEINQIFITKKDKNGKEKTNVAVGERCNKLIQLGCKLKFVGFPIASRAKCAAFAENLDLIDPRLPIVIATILWNHFFDHSSNIDIDKVIQEIIEINPCGLYRPDIKYPYMMKSFLYAAYCGMTASTLWDGTSQVNGGMIKVKNNGDLIAYYALESDIFKTYLYNNCYLEFPSTDEKHGDYAKVYKMNDRYYFNLNFQIRYRV